MAEGLNRVMLLGNLGADPELRFGQGADQAVLRLRLATTESYFDKRSNERKERTDWHNVVLFGKRAEALHKILSKGSTLFIEGRLQTSSYEKDGQKIWKTDVIANNVILTGGRGGGAAREDRGGIQAERPAFGRGGGAQADRGPAAPSHAGGADPATPASEDDFDGGDDIPF
ncbi:MAG: single-stranded DNA-binding protein [Polyangiales bacterium]